MTLMVGLVQGFLGFSSFFMPASFVPVSLSGGGGGWYVVPFPSVNHQKLGYMRQPYSKLRRENKQNITSAAAIAWIHLPARCSQPLMVKRAFPKASPSECTGSTSW